MIFLKLQRVYFKKDLGWSILYMTDGFDGKTLKVFYLLKKSKFKKKEKTIIISLQSLIKTFLEFKLRIINITFFKYIAQ